MEQNTPQNRDDELSVEELEQVAGGAEEEANGTKCVVANIYQCGKAAE